MDCDEGEMVGDSGEVEHSFQCHNSVCQREGCAVSPPSYSRWTDTKRTWGKVLGQPDVSRDVALLMKTVVKYLREFRLLFTST